MNDMFNNNCYTCILTSLGEMLMKIGSCSECGLLNKRTPSIKMIMTAKVMFPLLIVYMCITLNYHMAGACS